MLDRRTLPELQHGAGTAQFEKEPRSVRILGIDPGLGITGYAVIEAATWRDARVVEAGALRPGRGEPLPARLRHLHEEIAGLVAEFVPSRLVVEQVFVHRRHVRSALQMGHARGVILLAAASRDLPVDEFSPAEIKKALAGNGQASKRQMQIAVTRQCGLSALPEPADVADAIAIALCGVRRRLEAASGPRAMLALAGVAPSRGGASRRSSPTAEDLATLARRGVRISEPGGSPR